MDKQCQTNYCYILYNALNRKTYNGYTVNLVRRIKQHNSILKGGARATTVDSLKKGSDFWKYLVIVEADGMDKRTALSLEWHIRYPTCKRPRPNEFCSPEGRLRSLVLALTHDKFKHMVFKMQISQKYFEASKDLFATVPNLTLSVLDEQTADDVGGACSVSF